MTIRLGKAIGFGVVIWLAGFVWGTVVFMTPALKGIPSIPWVSRYPAISFPLLLLFPLLAYWFAPKCAASGVAERGVPPIGWIFASVNLLLDALVLVGAFKSGWEHFAFASVWLAYALLAVTAHAALKRAAGAR
jgi:hypothetical protein